MLITHVARAVSFAGLFLFASAVQAVEKPNVLFIAIDDMNDFPTFAGEYPDAKTPQMDRLAKRGTVFTNAHCQFPLCGPSRASVLSGMLPSTLGFDNRVEDEELQDRVRELNTELIHTYFRQQGYTAMAVGKLCHRHVPEGTVDASGGRGSFYGEPGRLGKNWSRKRTGTDWARAPESDEGLPDHHAADWAIECLQEKHDKPFFLMVGFLRPHVPWYVPKKWFDLYDKNEIELPAYSEDDLSDVPQIAKEISILPEMPRTQWAIENNQWRNIVQAYLACISFTDHQVGRVLKALDNSPYKKNTIVVLWSDHGYHMGEKNTFQKHSLWERSSHVPLLIAGPGIKGQQRCDRIVSLLDIYPTLTDMCDLPANAKNEGRSLVPLLKSPETPWPFPALTGWQKNSFAVQDERYRYIRYGDGSEELYDHQRDPNEWSNLAGDGKMIPIKERLGEFIPQDN